MDRFQEVVSRTAIKKEQAKKAFEAAMELLVDQQAPVPVVNGPVDLTKLTFEQRLGLLRGPKVSVVLDGKAIYQNVAVRAFMAVSSKAHSYFLRNPARKEVILPDGCASKAAIQHLLQATVTDQAIGGAEVVRVPGGASMQKNIQLYQAAIALGMIAHVQHVAQYLRASISRSLIAYEDLTAIVSGIPTSDPLFKHVADDLAARRYQKRIPDEKEFEAYLVKHPKLKDVMAEIDAQHEESRKRVKQAAARAQEKKAERNYNARVRALTEKLNKAKGGFVSLSHEEGELRRELGI